MHIDGIFSCFSFRGDILFISIFSPEFAQHIDNCNNHFTKHTCQDKLILTLETEKTALTYYTLYYSHRVVEKLMFETENLKEECEKLNLERGMLELEHEVLKMEQKKLEMELEMRKKERQDKSKTMNSGDNSSSSQT
ncbi:hypothetical protein C0J52_18341 [Blattella germanica]|nr:hypothetical protein C0J52_18341 [Blattella germanica]